MERRIRALRFSKFWVLGWQYHDGRFVWWSSSLHGWVPDAIHDDITLLPTEAAALAYLESNESRLMAAKIIERVD
jgi:hypothetical protein